MLLYQLLFSITTLLLAIQMVLSLESTGQIVLGPFPTIVNTLTCSSSNYYDSSFYSCTSCLENQEPDPNSVDGNGNSDRCRCATGFQTIYQSCGGVSSTLSP